MIHYRCEWQDGASNTLLTHLLWTKWPSFHSRYFKFFMNSKFCIVIEFDWCLFLKVWLRISEHWLGNGLVPNRQQAITWSNADPVYGWIYEALGEMSWTSVVRYTMVSFLQSHPDPDDDVMIWHLMTWLTRPLWGKSNGHWWILPIKGQ